MPRPRSLFRQHLPQLHLCSEPLQHMLIGGHMTRFFFFFFPPHFLIPPYVSMAHMTSLPSHPLHPDTISHFIYFFFPFRGGMATESDTHRLFNLTKNEQGSAAPTLMTSHYTEIDAGFYFFFFSLHPWLLWTLQIFLITVEC